MINRILSQNLPLSTFRSTSANPPQIFPESQQFPQFFSRHLLHPNRRIKCFRNDPNAMIRAFYFQYLMLCYEIENENYGIYIEKIKRFVLDENFSFLFLETDTDEIYNDLQFKRIILEFMDVLDSGEFPTTESALNYYPILDTVYVYFFRSLAIYAEITADFDSYVDKNIMFGFLLQNFGIDAQVFEQRCVKFIEAQVFAYEESPEQVYIVYKDVQCSSSGIGEEGHDLGSQYSRESRENGVPIGGSQENLEKQLREQYEQGEQNQVINEFGLYNVEGPINQNVSCLDKSNSEVISCQKLDWKKDKGCQQQNTERVIHSHEILNQSSHSLHQCSPPRNQIPAQPLSNNDYCLKLNGLSLSPSIDQLLDKKNQISDGLKTQAKSSSNAPSYSDPFASVFQLPKHNTITNSSSSVNVNIQNLSRDNGIKYPESISYLMNKEYGNSNSYGIADYHVSKNQYTNQNYIPTTQAKQGFQGPSKIETVLKQQLRPNQIPTRDISPLFPTLIKTTIQSRQSLTHRFPKVQQPSYATQNMGREFREDSLRLGSKFREAVMAKLSVSKEFTDSWMLMKMGEPYRSNVKNMKARSRQFRQSILNSLI